MEIKYHFFVRSTVQIPKDTQFKMIFRKSKTEKRVNISLEKLEAVYFLYKLLKLLIIYQIWGCSLARKLQKQHKGKCLDRPSVKKSNFIRLPSRVRVNTSRLRRWDL